MTKKIYVVMASYLESYPTGAVDREEKFKRAVDSFISNTYDKKKLVIVADGCSKTECIYNEKYRDNPDIVCLCIDKQTHLSGVVRNKGLEYVKKEADPEDIVCYLDTDDRFGEGHLQHIVSHFKEDFVIYDTHRYSPQGWYISKVAMKSAHIGTSSFAHKAGLEASWPDSYGHDWKILEDLSSRYTYAEIPLAQYYIHHTPNSEC